MGAAGSRFAYAGMVANWDGGEFMRPVTTKPVGELRCLACGGALEDPLRLGGSLRCLECREANEPIDPALIGADLHLAR